MEMEQQPFKISNDTDADEMLNEIMELKEEKARFETIAAGRIQKIQQDLKRETESIEGKIEFDKSMLQAYFLTVPAKTMKTMSKYKLLSGTLIMKKASQSIIKGDEEKLLKWVKASNPTFVKTKEEVNWGELKKTLKIVGGNVITEDGEIVEGATINLKSEEFEIK